MPKTKTAVTPQQIADRVLAKYLSSNELYNAVLDVSEDDFVAMENAILGDRLNDSELMATTKVEAERAMARQEVCFLLGVEIGRRIGGTR